jgi:hypothetical protein
MALTDEDRLQMVAIALMRHSVFTVGGGTLTRPKHTKEWPIYPFGNYKTMSPQENLTISHSYIIETNEEEQ